VHAYAFAIPCPFGSATQKSWRALLSAAKATDESERAKTATNNERLAI